MKRLKLERKAKETNYLKKKKVQIRVMMNLKKTKRERVVLKVAKWISR